MLSDDDWIVLSTMKRVLERFENASRILSGQQYPTLSIAYAVIFSLSNYIQSTSLDSTENKIKNMLSESFIKLFGGDSHEFEMNRVAALLDPMTACAQEFIVEEASDYF